MNAYFFNMTNEEKNNILDQHKHVYDGYVTSYVQPEKNQPLYVQDIANDKEGLTVNNKGVVTAYKNMNINEMRFDGKSTGLFSEEETTEQGHISPGGIYDTEESFESDEIDEKLDMIGDGEDDLEHGTFDDEDFGTMRSRYFDSEDDDLVFDFDSEIMKDLDDDESEEVFESLKESLDMFKRFTKYN